MKWLVCVAITILFNQFCYAYMMEKIDNDSEVSMVQTDCPEKTMATDDMLFSKVPGLTQPNVYIKDKNGLKEKLVKLMKGGVDQLQVIADFDSTLTKSHVDGKATSHTLDIFKNTKTLSQKYQDGRMSLYLKYASQLEDPHLTPAQKQEVLNLWWLGHESLVVGETMTLEDLHESTDEANTPLRDGCEETLSLLKEHGIPLTVVSAGLGEVIDYTLRNFSPTVVSNYMNIKDKKMLGFTKPTVSVYNKHQIPFPVQEGRTNIIVLGDSLGDCSMADNVIYKELVLKIGFLTGGDDQKLEQYCNSYDIVLRDDQTMYLVTALLRLVSDKNAS